jgi:hypothetical protein
MSRTDASKQFPKKSHDENSIQYPAQCDYAKGKKK